MNQMEIFKNPEFGSIRVIEENGKYLFCGTDVAAALGYSNSRDAIIRHALNKIMEKMGLLIHYGNGWGTTDAGAKFSMWHKGVLNSDSWHPELVDEIAKFLKK